MTESGKINGEIGRIPARGMKQVIVRLRRVHGVARIDVGIYEPVAIHSTRMMKAGPALSLTLDQATALAPLLEMAAGKTQEPE